MKNVKKALIGTALAGTLVVGAGFGTYSWFTDQSQATGTIENGTLTLGEMGSLFEHTNFAPSQVLLSNWNTVKNTGSLDQVLRATYTHSVDGASISKYKVGYLAVKYTEKPGKDKLKDWELRIQKKFFSGETNPAVMSAAAAEEGYEIKEGILTEEEVQQLAKAEASGTSRTLTLGEGGFWKLNDNQYIDIIFGVKLLDTAGNEYQGATYNANFLVEAKQTDNGAEFGPAVEEEQK
ncbi:hypothetical protein CU633_11920 [Bacillus sp. V3-13]|uniref:TasA family protein n=1 Tax=Bacillus sp. V3-13 TaxID=2053728 RepID=UPI000C773BE0|nr:TasA family protein [Bacillus sp. V3-13]PLR77244.1 hypothetical protein CU633_11920 [Bacillus sp. V3-13]